MLLERLKTETRPCHERLECLVGLAANRAEHCRQLERFFGFVKTWEPQVQRIASNLSDMPPSFWEARRKLPLLEADLLHFRYNADALTNLPCCPALPLNSLPQMLGSTYVLEGATLGGQIISRHLEQTLGLSDGQGYAFFQGYGKDTARRWKAFGQMLANYAAQNAHTAPDVEDVIVASASATFLCLCHWFEEGEEDTR